MKIRNLDLWELRDDGSGAFLSSDVNSLRRGILAKFDEHLDHLSDVGLSLYVTFYERCGWHYAPVFQSEMASRSFDLCLPSYLFSAPALAKIEVWPKRMTGLTHLEWEYMERRARLEHVESLERQAAKEEAECRRRFDKRCPGVDRGEAAPEPSSAHGSGDDRRVHCDEKLSRRSRSSR